MKKKRVCVTLLLLILIAAFSALPAAAKSASGNADAAVQTGWKTSGGKKYYIKPDGTKAVGLTKIGGKNYYFNKNGKLITDKKAYKIGGHYYAINAKGVAKKLAAVAERAVLILKTLPDPKLRNAFLWASKLKYRPVNTKGKNARYFANYGFVNKCGDCNVQACTFYCMAKVLGYDAHYVTGTVPQANGTDGKHAWVEIDIKGKTYVFDPNLAGQFSSVYGKNTGWKFQYGAKHTYKYQNIKRVN